MNYDDLYKRAYDILENSTPLTADCGTVCDKNCCKGDSKTGMLLFPHEKTTLEITEENGRRLAVCDGSCDRSERPLSCRIFPFFPSITEKGIEVVPDWRGVYTCPLISHADEIIFDDDFLDNVKNIGMMLSEDKEILAFMQEQTEDINSEKRIYNIFRK